MSESSKYFANSYLKARSLFTESCASAATRVESWQNPLRGAQGEKLYTDVAWFGDMEATKVLVLVSGTHGVEGFCGSGIQTKTIARGWYQQADSDVGILMIHGINPFGMAWIRRVNEDGVDLNRNFINFGQSLPENKLYDDLADVIVPSTWTEAIVTQTLNQIVEYLSTSQYEINDLAMGQYKYWYAPFYGGEVPTWSNRTFRKIVRKYLKNKQAVGLIDFHTGLGKVGTGQLISDVSTSKNVQSLTPQAIWGEKVAIAGTAESVASYSPQGTLITGLDDELPKTLCIAAAYEFGTVSEIEVFNALRADHWLHAYGDLYSPTALKIKQDLLNAFYSDRSSWQDTVCELAFTAQTELYQGLKSL